MWLVQLFSFFKMIRRDYSYIKFAHQLKIIQIIILIRNNLCMCIGELHVKKENDSTPKNNYFIFLKLVSVTILVASGFQFS